MSALRRTKSVEQSIADTDEPSTRLRKDLTWWDLTVFGVSVVIGAGIFTITASTAGNLTGPAISIAFVIAAVACGLAALCYAEFASTVPVAGSAYTFSYATFGEFAAWIIGWDLILEFAVASAVVAKGWSSYLGTVFGFGGGIADFGGLAVDWGALVIIALVTVLLVVGTKLSAHFSLVITIIKVSVVLLVVIVGAFYIKAANYTPFIPPNEAGEGATGADQSLFSLLTGAAGSDRTLAALGHTLLSPCVDLFVVGAHLSGQPLNHQLVEAGATLLRPVSTSADYRLFALETVPSKPGLVRVGAAGNGVPIEGELWRVPAAGFGTFVGGVPAPMVIGKVTLSDGSSVSGFLVEPFAVEKAADISAHGGWRRYRSEQGL